MTVLNTNTAAITAQYSLKKVQGEMEDAMTALSSGKRINTASDDAAGIAIAARMTAAINGFEQAIRNASDAQSMIDTAEGAHDEVANMLQRMRELAVQSGNDSNSDTDRAALQLEIDQLLTEIDRVSERTIWGGKTLMGGEAGGPTTLNFQVGATSAAGDQIAITIDDTSSDALGVGNTGLPSGGRITGHAGVSYNNDTGVLSVVGNPNAGDVVTFDMNGIEVTATVSYVDQYPNTAVGLAAQIKSAADVIINTTANNETLRDIDIRDNGDGTLTFTQNSKVSIDHYNPTSATQTATINEENGTITFDGTQADEAITLNINGVTVSVTTSGSDGFMDSNIGTATAFAQAIEDTAGLENVTVIDHADGSLTIRQKTNPFIDGAEVSLTNKANVTFEYDDTNQITVGGAWTEGQQVSMDIFGETVSFTVADDDSYDNTLSGITEQLAAAINDKGITGLSASKDDNANTLTLVADVNVSNGMVDNGEEFIYHTLGDIGTAQIRLHDTVVSELSDVANDAAYAAGDAYSFEVMGQKVSFVVGADGYTNDKEGVSEQMKDAIDDLGIEGLTVATAATTQAGVDITRDLTLAATTGSTVVTNITSLAADEVGDPTFSGSISVATADGAADAIDRIDAALVTLNEQRANLGAVSNRLDHTVTNLSNVNVNLQASRSRIEDADFAIETSNLTKSQILSQAATAMLAQANASKQSVLSLLQG